MTTLSLRDQLRKMIVIQELDLQITQIEIKKGALPVQLAELNQKISGLQKKIDDKAVEREEIQKNERQIVAAQELNQDRAARTEKRLEDVGNTKEFQAATKEMDQLKKLEGELAAQKEKVATDLQAIDEACEAIKAEQSIFLQERDSKNEAISKEESEIGTALSELTGKRQSSIDGLDRAMLSRYDRVRKARRGLGFVPAVAGRCKGCNMTIQPLIVNKLYVCEELQECPACQRMLYLPDAVDDKAADTSSEAE